TSGRIIAMYGGKSFKDNQGNLAVLGQGSDGYQSGSTFKVFYLVSALEQGIPTSQTFNAPPQINIRYPLCGSKGWDVANAEKSEAGLYNMYTATSHSVNTYFAQLMPMVKPSRAVEVARRMGIQVPTKGSLAYANHWNICSSVLGTGNTSVLDMASAFAVLANKGVRCEPYSIAKVVDRDNDVLLDRTRSKPRCEQVVEPGIAAQVTDILRGVVSGGTGVAANIGRPVAGKTGTAQGYTSAFFTGYTPQLATSVWVGHRKGLRSMYVNGRPVYGGTIPAPIFHDFMSSAMAGLPVVGFPPPPHGRPQDPASKPGVGVPQVTGQQLAQALRTLAAAGFKVSVRFVDSQAPKNQVVAQSPAAGGTVPGNSQVTLLVSKGGGGGGGQATTVVPAVQGLRAKAAAALLRAAGFVARAFYAPIADATLVGRVISQSPAAGSQWRSGGTVMLLVGRAAF
ncbi:MAG TPA: penicillin-binding transpeptidase domain-containing protein, partial [Actinomycetota bacterium]|nr:penicillin-binding transpeptidase domain-containing protein [Actinomycetota bacterium]